MPITINKQKLVTQLFTVLGKGKLPEEDQPARPVLEQFLYAICREGTTRERADQAYRSLQERFFDWNEVRVSSVRELADALGEVGEAEHRAQRIIDFLQEVFETTFSFDLEPLQKRGLKLAAKQLARYQAANDYAVAWVVQQSLAGHAVPLDGPSLRALRRLGLIDSDTEDLEALRASLEHQIPKARGPLFNDLISALADEYCWDDDPHCVACPMASQCPTGQEAKSLVGSGGGERRKPR
jgi:endonuclease III